MRTIHLVNHSSLIAAGDVASIARVIDSQLYYQVAPAWGQVPWRITADTTLADAYPLVLFDRADVTGVLGYHDVDPRGQPYGRVFVEPILSAGGGILDGVGGSVSATVSHEAIEIVGDAYANEWTDMLDGREVARELCDPVEADAYILRLSVSGIKAQVSNFVTPAWFSEAGPGPYDFLKRLSGPFTMSSGGYLIVRSPAGRVTNVWGDKYPEWKKASKSHPSARTAKRHMTHPPKPISMLPPPEAPMC